MLWYGYALHGHMLTGHYASKLLIQLKGGLYVNVYTSVLFIIVMKPSPLSTKGTWINKMLCNFIIEFYSTWSKGNHSIFRKVGLYIILLSKASKTYKDKYPHKLPSWVHAFVFCVTHLMQLELLSRELVTITSWTVCSLSLNLLHCYTTE